MEKAYCVRQWEAVTAFVVQIRRCEGLNWTRRATKVGIPACESLLTRVLVRKAEAIVESFRWSVTKVTRVRA